MSPHDSCSSRQLILDFESGLAERFDCALDVVRACAYRNGRPLKSIAADMDLSQSDLSRKLAENPDDPRRFTIGDLERFVRATGDCTVIYYLVEKFIEADEMKQKRALAELVALAPRLAALIKQAGGTGAAPGCTDQTSWRVTMDDGGRFPRGLPGTGSLLLMCVLVTACCVLGGLCLPLKRAWQQFCAWVSRAGS